MTEQERIEREERFEWWITCIPDKIEELRENLPKYISEKLDLSIISINILENYIIDTYEAEFLKSNKGGVLLSQLASYIGQVIKNTLPDATWYMELNNETDIYFGLPVLKFKENIPLSPYHLPLTAIAKNKGDLISSKIIRRLDEFQIKEKEVLDDKIKSLIKIVKRILLAQSQFNKIYPKVNFEYTCCNCHKKNEIEITPLKTGENLKKLVDLNHIKHDDIIANGVAKKGLKKDDDYYLVHGLPTMYHLFSCNHCNNRYIMIFAIGEPQPGRELCKISGIWNIE